MACKLDTTRIETALWTVEAAKEEAIALLTRHLKMQHWVKQKTSPVPWEAVRLQYWNSADYEEGVGRALDALAILSQCQELLTGFLKEKPINTVPNLALPKKRRSA